MLGEDNIVVGKSVWEGITDDERYLVAAILDEVLAPRKRSKEFLFSGGGVLGDPDVHIVTGELEKELVDAIHSALGREPRILTSEEEGQVSAIASRRL